MIYPKDIADCGGDIAKPIARAEVASHDSLTVNEKGYALAGMVGARISRIASVIGGDN